MKDLTNKKALNIFTICILFLIQIIEYMSFYMQKYGLINDFTSINASMVIWISIPFLILVYIKDIIDKKRKIDIYDYIFYVLVIIGIIVSIFSINPKISFLGVPIRREGFLSILGYYLLFINWKVNGTKDDINRYIKIFIIIGILNSIYAFLQIYTPFNFILRYTDDINMATGLCGNPNFFGTLMVTLLGILSTKFLIDEDIPKKDIILLILFTISLINGQSTGPMLTYLVTIIFIITFLKLKNKLASEKIIILILTIILSILITYSLPVFVSKLNNTIVSKEETKITLKKERCELCDLKGTIDSGGNGRLDIWINTLDVIKKYPILGVGYDNLGFAYPNEEAEVYYYVTNGTLVKEVKGGDIYVDNAHNVYLHTLATSGILGLIPFLILLLYTFIYGLKSNSKLIIILLGGFIAYSVQAVANISVIEVAPIYYIIIGLILSNVNKDKSLT